MVTGKVNNFDKWMLKIKNHYYSDNERMVNAYEKIKVDRKIN